MEAGAWLARPVYPCKFVHRLRERRFGRQSRRCGDMAEGRIPVGDCSLGFVSNLMAGRLKCVGTHPRSGLLARSG